MMVRHEDYDLHVLQPSKEVCRDCLNWKDFREKCWYFWEGKKDCSQRIRTKGD